VLLSPQEVFARKPLGALNNGDLTTNLPGPNNDLIFTSKISADKPVTVTYLDPGGATAPLTVSVNSNDVIVNLGRRNNAVSSTASDIAAAIAANATANALVSVTNKDGNDGTGVVAAMPAMALERPLGDVFFDLDKADLSDAARASLQKNADWMRQWSGVRITIEGHADSRGTNEYNLALGERRAASTRDYLVSLGIDASRVNIVSKGEEQPFCMDATEGCWAQNRRGHFIVTAK
jgi:peptidoglycan-associated lipoprotein